MLLKPFNKNDEVEQNNDELEETLKNYEDFFQRNYLKACHQKEKSR